MNKSIFIILALFLSGLVQAQKHELGLFIGTSGYHGDIGDNKVGEIFKHQSPSLGLTHRINLHKYLCFRTRFQYGKLKADDLLSSDSNIQERKLSFESEVIDLSAGFEFHFHKFETIKRKITYTPFIFGGISLFSFNPKAKTQMGQWVDLQPLGTEGQETNASNKDKYSLSSWSIPFGLGYKANVGERLGFTFEWTWHATNSDYIDDVSGYYPDESYLSNEAAYFSNPGRLGEVTGKTRGNPNTKDWFNFVGFTVTYKIKNKLKQCPKALRL